MLSFSDVNCLIINMAQKIAELLSCFQPYQSEKGNDKVFKVVYYAGEDHVKPIYVLVTAN